MAKNKKRPTRRGHRRQLNILQSLFFIVMLVGVGYILLKSPVFSIKQVRVEGVKTLKVEDIQSLSGINLGTNTFKLNLKEIQDMIALNPMVKQVQVTRQYPSAVLVRIEERKAVALLSWKGEYIAVDAEGYYITGIKDFSKANLPIITGIRLGNLTLGNLIPGEGLAACLSFIQKMDQNLLANLSEINGTDSLGIVLFTMEGTEVRLGASERVEEKLALLREALKNSYGRKVEYIDITFSGKPVIKFRDTPVETPDKPVVNPYKQTGGKD